MADAEIMTDKIALALVEIDPNTANTEEGRAFVRKLLESEGDKANTKEPFLPETPVMCVKMVSGKVIQI